MARIAAALACLAGAACSIGALDGYAGGTAAADAGPESNDAAGTDASVTGEAGGELVSGPSCKAIKEANPSAPDGRYRIVPPDMGAAAFEADCDMTQDGGGWMRVTEAMIIDEKKLTVTTVRDVTETGGLLLRTYANGPGCSNGPDSAHLVVIRDSPKWTQLRARYDFYGRSSCFDILGANGASLPFQANMNPFFAGVDVARDMIKMGGSAGDAFDGKPHRCDNVPENFWAKDPSTGRRSLLAILRRASSDLPAGLGTTTSCTTVADGVTSPTYWEYRDVFVR